MMNICIESQLLNHPRRSGLMTYTEGLVNAMSLIDKENDYILVYYSLKRKPEEMPGPDAVNFRKRVIRVPDREFFARQKIIDQFFLPRLLKNERVDIFHRPSGYTMPDCKDVFKILTVHDLRTLTMGDRRWAQNIKNYEKALSSVDLVVVVSECTKRDLIEYFHVNEKKIRVTYLGADKRYRRIKQDKIEEVKAKYGLRSPFFLSVGSVPRKNIEGIIRGFGKSRHNNEYSLVLNCRFDVDKYKQLGNELGLDGKIIFISNVGDKDLVALYNACHCFAFPSLYEGFGLPILEAMRCGAPVITSNVSSCPEVAGDAALLVNPRNADEIGNAMDQMCRDEKLRQSLIEKGFKRATMFSWEKFAKEMKDVYSMA